MNENYNQLMDYLKENKNLFNILQIERETNICCGTINKYFNGKGFLGNKAKKRIYNWFISKFTNEKFLLITTIQKHD